MRIEFTLGNSVTEPVWIRIQCGRAFKKGQKMVIPYAQASCLAMKYLCILHAPVHKITASLRCLAGKRLARYKPFRPHPRLHVTVMYKVSFVLCNKLIGHVHIMEKNPSEIIECPLSYASQVLEKFHCDIPCSV